MSDNIEVTIDIHQAGLDLEPEELEAYSYRLVGELDELSESAYLMRSSQVPDGSKAGEARFDLGFIKAQVSFGNLQKLLDWLGNLFYGKTLEVNYEENGTKVAFKYQTGKQLEQQLQAIERLKNLQVKVVKDATDS